MAPNSAREPAANLRAAAGQLHELFTALLEQGFSEGQALAIIGSVIANGQKS